jgi:glutamate dehydrogenase/leucine dehydrogenase
MSADHKKGMSWGVSTGILIVGIAFFYGTPEKLRQEIFSQNDSPASSSTIQNSTSSMPVSCTLADLNSDGRFPASGPSGRTVSCSGSIVELLQEGEFSLSLKRLQTTLSKINLPSKIKDKLLAKFSKPFKVTAFDVKIKMDDGSDASFPAFRVLHNNDNGPGKGGIRFGMDVDLSEVSALAMGMTYKAPLTGLPLGGAKGGVKVNTKELSEAEISRVARAYFGELSQRKLVGPDIDVPAPDMNTNPKIMEWMLDEHLKNLFKNGELNNRGLPERLSAAAQSNASETDTPFLDAYLAWAKAEREIAHWAGTITGKAVGRGGSKGRTEATGLGVYYVAREFVKVKFGARSPDAPMKGLKVALQGFGNVGSYAGKYFHEKGGASVTTLVEWANVSKKHNIKPFYVFEARDPEKGLPINEMFAYQQKHGNLEGFTHPEAIIKRVSADDALNSFLEADVDMLVPAAMGNQIRADNWSRVKAPAIIEAANNPTDPVAEKLLTEKGVEVIPDSLANAGGVTVSYFEMVQNTTLPLDRYWETEKVFEELDERMTSAFQSVWETKRENSSYSWRNAGQHVSLQPFISE